MLAHGDAWPVSRTVTGWPGAIAAATTVPPRHSRVGGNPFSASICKGAMESRLRGNDKL